MENKDQNNTVPNGASLGDMSLSSDNGVVKEPSLDTNALSYEPGMAEPLISQEQPRQQRNPFLRFVRRADVILLTLLLVGVVGFLVTTHNRQQNNNAGSVTTDDKFGSVQIPLGELISGKDLTLAGAANVTINGPIQLNDDLNITPSLQPTGAKAGQIYYDKGNNQLAYYNGSEFVFLTSAQAGGVQSLGGGTGQLTLGGGLALANNQLANTGVLSVQGSSGAVTFTAGAGIVINGTNFSNSGVLSVAAGTPNVHVNSDGNGNVSVSVDTPVAGTGTVTSGTGGTVGRVPLFTASQNIEDSIITQSGLTVTISGDLSVVTGGLTLSNALTVSNGGTGTNSLAANGVLVGHGTAAVSAVAAGGPGLCLVSTAGVPTWAACPSGGGVTSLNSLTGGLSIANASGVGSTITIDDASTVNKGIASFNATNFTVTGGNVNTVQNINSGATPTFAGVNTNNITPSAALTVGVSAQTALLQGSTTTITSNGAGNNIVLNSAGTIELQDNTNVTGSVTTSGDLAVNGGNITSTGALNVTPAGALTIGATSQTLTLQGGASTSFRATSGANSTVVAFTNPTANTTLNFPALTAGTYTICTTSGNCAGAGVTLQAAYSNSTDPEITLDATRGALTIRDNATPLGANLLEVQNNAGSATYLAVNANGVTVTGTATVSGNINSSAGALQTGGTTRIDNSGNAVNLGTLTLSGAISGGTSISGSGNINSTGGSIQTNGVTRVDNSGNLINIVAVTASGSATFQGGVATLGTNSQAGTIVLNDGSSNTGTLAVAALGQNTIYTLPDPGTGSATICLTTGNCSGVGGGVTSPGGTTNKLSKFTGSNTIGDSSISDDGTNVTVAVDVIIQGGDLTVGTTSQAASIVLHDGNGQTTTLQAGDSTGNLSFVLPTNTGLTNQCLKQSGTGNQLVWQDCDGGAGGSSATLQTSYNNSVNPEIVLNSSVGGLTIRDNSTPLGTNLFEIQNNAGSTTYLAVTVTGVSVNGTATATGNINTSGGTLQTNGTNRIDNSGNAVNIGNITGSGAMTIASIGAGNDITINGADQFIVQDASVFNALSTFNANIDLGANDIVGTTGNINLSNFDVVGTTGNVTAGTYNGQTISNAANFTGTVAVAGNTTLTGDLAVNGGDITSTGALNITPAGTLTAGVTGQQLILQGNANTQLTATGGGFTTTVGFAGTPTGAVRYDFDRAAAAGTYTICTTVGNCSGSGGVTTLGGTTGTIPVFTGAQTLGDSLLSQSGAVVTVNGNINLTTGNQFTVNGTQISSANLSNDSNLAKLGSSQTFTGNTQSFKNGADSTNAFNVQNAAGNRVLTVNTTGAQIVLGTSNTLDGTLVFENMSNANKVTILPGIPTANRTLTLPNASGILCTDSGNCAGAGATLQTAYNFSVGGTTPKIKLDSTLLGVDIQDADTTIGANLFNVRGSNGSGLGSVLFGVGNTGEVTLQNASNSTTAFRLLTSGGTNVLAGDTTNGRVVLGQASTLSGNIVFMNASNANTTTLTIATATSNQTITLPNATGTVCLSSGNCSGSGSSNTLQAAYDAGNTITATNGRDLQFSMADTATDPNYLIDLQCDTSCGGNGRFAIQDDGTDVFAISPSGTIFMQPTVASTTALNFKTVLNNNMFTIDSVNSRIGINLGANITPTLAGTEPGLELKGAFRISGTSGMDTYTTPLGIGIAAKINIENQSLPNFGQIMAMGLSSTSDVTSRALSLFDARATRHQPTLAVISPDENASVGFSWNGTNNASVQTSDSAGGTSRNIILQSGNVTAGNSNTGDVQVNTGSTVGNTAATGTIYLVTGDGLGTNTSSGDVNVDSGVSTGTGTRGAVKIGVQNTDTVLIGRGSGTTTLQGGTTNVTNLLAANGNVNLGDSAADLITVNGTIQGGSPLVFEGATADANELTLSVATLTADRTITLPNEDGVVCLQSSSTCGFATGSAGSYIQNQNAGQQATSNFWISGTGRADGALQAPSFDTATAVALAIGTTNATAINLNQNTVVGSGKTLTVAGGATSLVGAATGDALTVSNSTSTGNIAIFRDNAATVFLIQDGGIITATPTAASTTAFSIQSPSYTLFSADTVNNTVHMQGVADNQGTYNAIWMQGPKNSVTAMIGGNDNTSAYLNNDFSGNLRFNGSNVAWGDVGYYPMGGGNGNNGVFRFSTTGSVVSTTPNAKVGVGDLYVNGNAGIGINSPGYKLDVVGDVNISTGSSYRINGTAICVSTGCTPAAGSGNYIQNQNASQQATSNFWISGTGRADTALQTISLDTATSVPLSIGTGNASSITLGSNTNNTALTLNSGTGAINVGTSSSNRTVNIGTGNANQLVTIGSTTNTSSLTLQGGTNGVKITTAGTTSAFLVQDATGQALFNIDASNGWTINNGNIHPNNLLENPSFEANGSFTASGWNYTGTGSINGAGTPHHGKNEFVYTSNGTLLILSSFKYLEAQPGDQFYAEAWYKAAAGTNGGASFSFTYYDKNKSSIGSSSATNFSAANTSYTLATVTGTAPANTAYVRLSTGVNASSTTGSWFLDDYTLVRSNQQAPFAFKNNVDSTSALQVLTSGGVSVLNVDTTNSRVGIGSATPTRTLDVSVNTTSTNTLPLLLQQAGTGDTGLELKSTSKNYYVGIDNTDGAFKIASSTSANGSFTVGNTSIGTGTDSNANGAQAYKVTASGTGTVSSVSVYISSLDVTPANRMIQVGVYGDNGSGTSPNVLLGSSTAQTATVGWNTISLSGVSITSGTVYWIAMAENGATIFKHDSPGGVTAYHTGSAYPMTNPFAANSANSTDKPSFYITVANAGGSDNFNGTNLLSMTDFGATTFQNSSNSAAAFRVLNAAAVPQFIVDTNSSAVYIGAAGSGTTSLTVSGSTTMQGSASVTSGLTVGGEINAGSYSGAGLTDCDSINSKLLWDATTKQFSCGSDKPNVVTYKTTQQTATSAFVTDTDFTFTMGANETWVFQINTDYATTGTTWHNYLRISAPAGSTCDVDISNLYQVQNVSSTTCGDTNAVAQSATSSPTDTNDQQYVIWGRITTSATAGPMQLAYERFDGTGSIIARPGGIMTAYKLTGADLAEAYYTNDNSILPGTVVGIDSSMKAGGVKKTQSAYDTSAMGIISTAPGQILGDSQYKGGGRPVLLALSGRIPVRVSLENGPIKAGDYLTTSSTPGVAMKATKAGQMIGKALEGFDSPNSSAQGTVMTFANLTYADPNSNVIANNDIQGTTMVNLNVSDKITTKDLAVTGSANIHNLIVGTMTADEVTIGGNANFGGDINLQGVGLSRNAITKKFVASHPIAIGAVVIADPDNDGQVTTTTTAADTRVLGVALTQANAGDQVTVAIGGSVQVKTADNALVKGGDLLGSSTTEGAADKVLVPTPGSLIGKALSKPVDGMTWVLVSLQ